MGILSDPALRYFLAHMNHSLERWTGRSLANKSEKLPETLFNISAALVAHGAEEDPIFCFGNQTALDLFEVDWTSFTALPSRKSAEIINQPERATMLADVAKNGFTDRYQGTRISSTGQKFHIEQATVWDIRDEQDLHIGQAALFSSWQHLS